MRTPAQQAASRANGARSRGPNAQDGKHRSTTKPFCHNQLAKATVLKKESRKGLQELVRQHMLSIAPRDPVEQDAVEEICSATWRLYRLRAIERKAIDLELAAQSSPDDLECLVHACDVVAGKNSHLLFQGHETRLQNIIRRSLARIEALRRIAPQEKFEPITSAGHASGHPPAGPAGRTHCAPEPLSMRLRPHIPVPRTPARGLPKPPSPPLHGEPGKNPGKPAETQEKPRETQEEPAILAEPPPPSGRRNLHPRPTHPGPPPGPPALTCPEPNE